MNSLCGPQYKALDLSLTSDSDVNQVSGFAQASFTPVHSTVGGGERSLDGAGGRTWMYLPGSIDG